jgi:putative DNA methylase
MRDEAERHIGHLYPKIDGRTVIAWLWARTVTCPNPACGARMPLVRSFVLSTKKGKQAWVEPQVDRSTTPPRICFTVKTGADAPPEGTVNRGGARCLACDAPVPFDHVRAEGKAGRMDARLMAIVAEGARGRQYLSPTSEHEAVATQALPSWKPDQELQGKCRVSVPLYGMTTFADLFTPRQLVALTTFSDLVAEARERVHRDAVAAGLPNDGMPLHQGGAGASAYADAVAVYLAFAVDRLAMTGNNLVRWNPVGEKAQHAFGRQALPMLWDFAEPSFLAHATGSVSAAIELAADPLSSLADIDAIAVQADATDVVGLTGTVVSTDPPYYDNIGYADLSDFFYVWLRRSLKEVYPDLFATLLVPKALELVATPYRFDGDRDRARQFFETGLGRALERLQQAAHSAFPVTVYYAFKQAETDEETDEADDGPAVASTGWQTMLEGLMQAGFQITGTWPMRTEMRTRQVAMGTNALASSIVLACRPRPANAPTAARRDFLAALKRELPPALRTLQQGNVAPVDLAQAAIGPGMAVYSRYRQVLEADGSPLRVRAALALINQTLDEYLAAQEGEYDADTRWALAWFEQYRFNDGPFGVAETLSKAKNTSPEGMVQAGILQSRAGKVRLLRRDELDPTWDPRADRRPTAWEAVHHLIRALEDSGEAAAAALLAGLGALADPARDLAYRLYTICERKGWAQDALGYNMLVVAWPRLKELAARASQDRLL